MSKRKVDCLSDPNGATVADDAKKPCTAAAAAPAEEFDRIGSAIARAQRASDVSMQSLLLQEGINGKNDSSRSACRPW